MRSDDRSAPQPKKKKLEEALRILADRGVTSHPLLRAFFIAHHINLQSGVAVIAPWDIEPGHALDDWGEAAMALAELPSLKSRRKAAEQIFEKARKGNKHYNALNKRKVYH